MLEALGTLSECMPHQNLQVTGRDVNGNCRADMHLIAKYVCISYKNVCAFVNVNCVLHVKATQLLMMLIDRCVITISISVSSFLERVGLAKPVISAALPDFELCCAFVFLL